jgi:DNA invertase Pin-like site-specific DNA recombinase
MQVNDNMKVASYCRDAYIPQHIPAENRKAAIYCRTATKDDVVIEWQEERLLQYAEEYGYVNTVHYIDNGKNGRSLNRPAMKQLIEDINAGEIQTVLVTRADRIARDLAPLHQWMMITKDMNVKCISLDSFGKSANSEFAFWSDVGLLLETLE